VLILIHTRFLSGFYAAFFLFLMMQKPVLVSLIGIFLSVASFAKENLPFKSTQSFHFLENKGQIKDQEGKVRSDIQFALSGGGINVFIGDGALHYQFSKTDGPEISNPFDKSQEQKETTTSIYRLDVELIGANKQALASPEGKQSFLTRYYEVDAGETSGPINVVNSIEAYSYDKITYRNVYPGIDWVVYVKNNKLEYDFVVKPWGNPNDIKLKYTGATQLKHNSNGSLTAVTPLGIIEEHTPYSFQADGKEVTSSFNLEGDIVSFNVGNYEGTLTIDPSVIWSSYFGGAGQDEYTCIIADTQGDIYAAGVTTSAANIATNGTTYQGNGTSYNGFISKFDSDGNLLWSSYWGGGSTTRLNSIATDALDNVYVAGTIGVNTASTMSFAKFLPNGAFVSGITWGAPNYLDFGNKVVCDNANNIYFGGTTKSPTGMPVLNAYQPVKSNYGDGFIIKMDPNMNVVWATYYGSLGEDRLNDMKVDNLGNLYVAGYTLSDTGMVTVGPVIYNTTGQNSIYTAKFNSNGNRVWGAMCGTQSEESGGHLAVDTMGSGAVYLTAFTYGGFGIATPGAYITQPIGAADGFLIKYDTSGTQTWATYISQGVSGLAVDETGVYLTGGVANNSIDAVNGFETSFGGGDADGILCKFSKDGDFIWASYMGGIESDYIYAIALNQGEVYVAGYTRLDDFLTNTTHQPSYGGGYADGFIAKITRCMQLPNWPIDGPAGLCVGSTEVYNVPSSGWVSNPYTWSFTGGISGNSNTESISVFGNTAGSATIMMSANNGCDTINESINIVVHPLPEPAITGNGYLLSTGSFVTYQWYLNGTPIPGATNQDYTASTDGDYTVTVTDANGCTGTSAISPVGVAVLNSNISSILIVPNPSDGVFTITGYLSSTNAKAEMEIIDVTGSVIYKTQLKVVNNQLNHPINLEQRIAAGTYYIKLTTDAATQVIRFVKS